MNEQSTIEARVSRALVSGAMVLVALLLLGVVGVTLLIAYVRFAVPLDLEPVRKIDGEPTILLLDAEDRKFASRLAPGPRVHDLLAQADTNNPGARNIIDAVVAIEDRKFWNRSVFDFASLAKAVVVGGRGGSTIPMQLIKNVYWRGESGGGETTVIDNPAAEQGENRYVRKLQEILFSPDLESQFDKEQIMGVYLRVAPEFGGSLRGIERVSLFMFGVYPDNLTAAQAASLAATLKAPTGYDPRNVGVPGRLPPRSRGRDGQLIYTANAPLRSPRDCGSQDSRVRNNRCRALTILAEMRTQAEQGPGAASGRTMLDEAEYQAAVRETLTLGTCDDPYHMAQQRALGLVPPDEGLCRRTPRQFISQAIDHVDALGLESRPGTTMEIRTTFDRKQHSALVDVVESLRSCKYPPYEFGISTVAANGDVAAMIELPAQGLPPPKGQETAFGIPPGSTLKPFIYGAWLDQNPKAGPATLLPDSDVLPTVAKDPSRWVGGSKGLAWWPNRNQPASAISVEAALAKSRNRPATLVGAMLGPDELSRTFARAGIDFHGRSGSLRPTLPHPFPRSTADKWPMAILGEGGAARVIPLQLVTAYATFANSGRTVAPQLVRSVTYVDNAGRRTQIATPSAVTPRRLFSPGTAAAIDAMMAETPRVGTAAGLGLDRFGVHGKTGTVSDARYGWFIGYPADRAIINGVWIYSPKVALVTAAGEDRNGYLPVTGRDAARVFGALIRRQTGDLSPILADDVCPAKGLELSDAMERAQLRVGGR